MYEMYEYFLTNEQFKKLEPFNLNNIIHTESDFYWMPESKIRLFKIYKNLTEEELYLKRKTIEYLIDFNNETKIYNLVVPLGIVIVDNEFRGEIQTKINGKTLTNYIYDKEIPFNKKIDKLKDVGYFIDMVKNSNPKYNACFSDIHTDNFMIHGGNIIVVDATSMKLYDLKGIQNFYLCQLSEMEFEKYEVDSEGIVIPSINTDIYCYIMILLRFLSGSDLYILGEGSYFRYLDKLEKNGFDINLINSFRSIYEEDMDNINPYIYLDSLKDIDDEKLAIMRKIL